MQWVVATREGHRVVGPLRSWRLKSASRSHVAMLRDQLPPTAGATCKKPVVGISSIKEPSGTA